MLVFLSVIENKVVLCSSFLLFSPTARISVDKHAKKELDQYPAILTSHLVDNPYISACKENKFSGSHFGQASTIMYWSENQSH